VILKEHEERGSEPVPPSGQEMPTYPIPGKGPEPPYLGAGPGSVAAARALGYVLLRERKTHDALRAFYTGESYMRRMDVAYPERVPKDEP